MFHSFIMNLLTKSSPLVSQILSHTLPIYPYSFVICSTHCLFSSYPINLLLANRKETRLNMVAVMFQACKPALFYAFIGVVNLLLFSTYTLTTGNPLTPAIVFTTISLMSNVRLTATGFILNGVVGFQEAKIAFSRIQVSAQFCLPLDICMDTIGFLPPVCEASPQLV